MPGGRPPKYRADFHPADCIRMGKAGRFAVEMALEWDITVQTIHAWCAEHPEFSDAFTRAKQHRAAWFMDAARGGLVVEKGYSFNAQVLGIMLRYDGVSLDDRRIKLPKLAKAETFAEQSKVVMDAFSRGDINAKEANQVADLISKSAKIDEVTELRRMLEEIDAARKAGL